MRVSPLFLVPLLVVMQPGCKGLPCLSHTAAEHPDSNAQGSVTLVDGAFARAQLKMQAIAYDGTNLSGRLLLSPTGSSLRIDKRFIEGVDLTVDSVVACDNGNPIPYVITDVLARVPRDEDILILKPGFWYGKDIHIFLFAEHVTKQPSPLCFEAELAYHALDVKSAARIHIRAERTPPQLPSQDARVPMQEAPETERK